MPPLQPQQPDDTDILIDAILDQNSKLDDIAQTNDIQVEAIAESNVELNELNRTADIIVDMISKKMDQVQKVKLDGISVVKIKGDKGDTPVKGKDYFTKEEIEEIIQEILYRIKKV